MSKTLQLILLHCFALSGNCSGTVAKLCQDTGISRVYLALSNMLCSTVIHC